jgi:hypothetical protein
MKRYWDPRFHISVSLEHFMYLANQTRPDIAFAINLLYRHSAALTKRHWTGAKHILRYLNVTKDLGLETKIQL